MMDHLLARRAEEFPITRSRTFLAHAAFSPLPARVAAAIGLAAQRLSEHGQGAHVEARLEDGARRSAAELLKCRAEQIAFTANTSSGMAALAAGMRWQRGDNIVLARDDFPAVTNPWRAAAERHGVEVRTAEAWTGDLLAHADDRTRAVAVSTVHFATGQRLPLLAETARQLRERGVFVVVDAIQTLGTEPFAVGDFDAVVADGHKWLLAPKGTALLYCSEALAGATDVLPGWRNTITSSPYAAGGTIKPGAARFEAGSPNIVGIVGLGAALDLFAAVGLDAVSSRLDHLADGVAEVLKRHGRADASWQPNSPLLSVPLAAPEVHSIALHLDRRGVSVSIREDGTGQAYLRIAPHFYNDIADIARLDDALGSWHV